MPKVSGLSIKRQSGTDSTYFATWEFDASVRNTTATAAASSGVAAGSLVSIRPGATYYNGVAIPDWVMADRWYVLTVSGDRAVIDSNAAHSNSIMSPVNVADLVADGSPAAVSAQGDQPGEDTVDHYRVEWFYDTGDDVWFEGSSSDSQVKQATYSAPSNALRIKVVVTPVSKTYRANDEDVSYWTGTPVPCEHSLSVDAPEKPSTPTVEIEGYSLSASLENISDPRADQVRFEVYDGTQLFASGTVTVLTRQAAWSCAVTAGGLYRVRCAAVNISTGTSVVGEFSDFTSAEGTLPSAPARITALRATSESSVHIEWEPVASAETYDIEHATKLEYFDGSDQTTVTSGAEQPHFEKSGLESGQEYFFRVRAANDKGTSAWCEPVSVVVGKTPTPPTTWSSNATVTTGQRLYLYWVHNSRDNSSETFAEVELVIGGSKDTRTVKNEGTGDDADRTGSYEVDTSKFAEGTTVLWRVRTAGVTKEYGEWSVQRTVSVYAPPTLRLSLTDASSNPVASVKSFPLYISGLTGPKTQSPVGYHVAVKALDAYRTTDAVGNLKMVNRGDEVYSAYVDTSDPLLVELSAGNVDLENGARYTVAVTASMDSGLTVESTLDFSVLWDESVPEPDAEIGIDKTSLSAYVRPYCIDSDRNPVTDVILSVYRRDFDGGFTEIATGLDPLKNSFATDPHPALDYARYRIVAVSKSTGAVSHYDAPPYPVGCGCVVLQWAEAWQGFDEGSGDALENPPWSGSMLKMPYNIDVSESSDPEVTLVEYVGRSHPVSYYGTHRGSKATWNTAIPRSDRDTLHALRRLANWMGDVYVREPSGSGYWASVKVSFSQKHRDLTVPVTLEVTRVEGGA